MEVSAVAMIVEITGGAEPKVIEILEEVDVEYNPRELYEFWVDQLRGTLPEGQMVMVETREIA